MTSEISIDAIRSVKTIEKAWEYLLLLQADEGPQDSDKLPTVPALECLCDKIAELYTPAHFSPPPDELLLLAFQIELHGATGFNKEQWRRHSLDAKHRFEVEPSLSNALAETTIIAISSGITTALSNLVERIRSIAGSFSSRDVELLKSFGKRSYGQKWQSKVNGRTIGAVLDRNYKLLIRRSGLDEISSFTRDITLLFDVEEADTSPCTDAIYEFLIIPHIVILGKLSVPTPKLRHEISVSILGLEHVVQKFIRSRENATHFHSVMSKIKDALWRAGSLHKQQIGYVGYPAASQQQPRVAFLLHGYGVKAHTEALLTYFEGLNRAKFKSVKPVVFVLGPRPANSDADELEYRLRACNVPVRYCESDIPFAPLNWLPSQCSKEQINALVWVSIPKGLAFWTGFKPAPVHIWWSMKYHNLEVDGLDGYLTVGTFDKYRNIHGRNWRAAHAATPELYNQDLEPAALEARKKILSQGAELIVGCLARTERHSDRDYISSVVQLLERHPKTAFVWAGRQKNESLSQALESKGLAHRSHFIGWVDTQLWAQVFDIYADTFPFASGQTGIEAMAASVPLVILRTPESLETSAATLVTPLYDRREGTREEQEECHRIFNPYDGKPTFPVVDSIDEYVERVTALTLDKNYRLAAGQSGKAYYERFLRDEDAFTDSVTSHILEIIGGAN